MLWILGPQLIGLIMIAIGCVQKKFPPKSINSLYGYRTALSMQNQQNWDEGNLYSANLLVKIGLTAFITGLLLSAGLYMTDIDDQALGIIQMVTVLLSAFTIPFVVIYFTERHLKHIFIKAD
ncbi:SdpI family protein [Mucilaginibacter sp. KACC 22063]|uniref:SdpI family protein n=1 Tax=Mucilaginibacter sp. KACC 22063 TaxID=3025666 RepID=UPI002365AE5A|nr:SdpI family protein [Mucilaginibacter sp. KACC 22063]WDF55971.1 SdpI family protein [Mucilaginibacter sp. KACC 22063]